MLRSSVVDNLTTFVLSGFWNKTVKLFETSRFCRLFCVCCQGIQLNKIGFKIVFVKCQSISLIFFTFSERYVVKRSAIQNAFMSVRPRCLSTLFAIVSQEVLWFHSRFISEMIQNLDSYRRRGSCRRSIEQCHFQWPPMTANPDFKDIVIRCWTAQKRYKIETATNLHTPYSTVWTRMTLSDWRRNFQQPLATELHHHHHSFINSCRTQPNTRLRFSKWIKQALVKNVAS